MNRKIALIIFCAIIKNKNCTTTFSPKIINSFFLQLQTSATPLEEFWSTGGWRMLFSPSTSTNWKTKQPRTRRGGEEEEWIKRNPVTSKAVLVYACMLVCFHLPELDTGITGLRGLHSTAGCSEALESVHRATGTLCGDPDCRRRFKKTTLPSSGQSKYCRGFTFQMLLSVFQL